MDPLVISFYTRGTPYEDEARKLIASCQQWEIEAEIDGVSSRGSWESNCGMKAEFILSKLKKHRRDVFWVDADAVFLQKPLFTEFEGHFFSVRFNPFLPKSHESRIISNAIFAADHPDAHLILEKWRDLSVAELKNRARVMEFWDQAALRDVLSEGAYLPMPLKYSKIFDLDDLFIDEKEVVIEHYQASRRIKNKVSPT